MNLAKRFVKAGPQWLANSNIAFNCPPGIIDRAAVFRTDSTVIHAHLSSQRSRIILFLGPRVLLRCTGHHHTDSIRYVSHSDLCSWFFDKDPSSNAFDKLDPPLAFLGLDTSDNDRPYFTLELTGLLAETPTAEERILEKFPESRLTDMRSVARMFCYTVHHVPGAWVGQARSLLDWHMRHKYCPWCGSRTAPAQFGWRRVCSTQPGCLTGVQNYAYPRIDPVVMCNVVHPNHAHILLGRSRNWPRGMYSCVAGFIEPGESIESAARREVLEETGISVTNVEYIGSQPWPMPASLMLGCMGQAESIDINLIDKELEHADWFSVHQVQQMADFSDRRMANLESAVSDESQTFIPPTSSIAGTLIREWLLHWAPPINEIDHHLDSPKM